MDRDEEKLSSHATPSPGEKSATGEGQDAAGAVGSDLTSKPSAGGARGSGPNRVGAWPLFPRIKRSAGGTSQDAIVVGADDSEEWYNNDLLLRRAAVGELPGKG